MEKTSQYLRHTCGYPDHLLTLNTWHKPTQSLFFWTISVIQSAHCDITVSRCDKANPT